VIPVLQMNKFVNICNSYARNKNNFNAKTTTVHMLIVEHSSKAVESSSFMTPLCDQYSDETDGQLNTNVFIPNEICQNVPTKTRPSGGGVRQIQGIILRRRPSHEGREKPRTPTSLIHSGTVAHVRNSQDQTIHLCFSVGQTRGFFNHILKFAPTGSRTQDLRSATQTT
jgi:hypothetical protein